jgi:hypothetical protein
MEIAVAAWEKAALKTSEGSDAVVPAKAGTHNPGLTATMKTGAMGPGSRAGRSAGTTA